MNSLDQEGGQKFLTEFNQKVERKLNVEELKEELLDIMMEIGEPILMETGLDEEARQERLSKRIQNREMRLNTDPSSCKGSSTLKKKNERKKKQGKNE